MAGFFFFFTLDEMLFFPHPLLGLFFFSFCIGFPLMQFLFWGNRSFCTAVLCTLLRERKKKKEMFFFFFFGCDFSCF